MTHIFALLYAISAFGFIVACLPQIIQILRTKTVEGISLQTYDMWFIMQVISMPYIYQSGDLLWLGANVVWVVYYGVMIVLIEHYRYPSYVRAIVTKLVQLMRLLPAPAHAKK